MNLARHAADLLARVRERRPLIHHLTNTVVMNDCANICLHLGAAPVMAHAPEEVAEMAAQADALVLNIGTLDSLWLSGMRLAAATAGSSGLPIVLDPVGAGATRLRTEAARELLSSHPVTVLKGNQGEVATLAGVAGQVRGVDAAGGGCPVTAAVAAAQEWGVTAAVTGAQDIVSDGRQLLLVDNGSPWLGRRTGSGCGAGTAVAAFLAVAPDDPPLATAAALAAYGLAAEIAAAASPTGPAAFHLLFLDALYHLTPDQVRSGTRITSAPAHHTPGK